MGYVGNACTSGGESFPFTGWTICDVYNLFIVFFIAILFFVFHCNFVLLFQCTSI